MKKTEVRVYMTKKLAEVVFDLFAADEFKKSKNEYIKTTFYPNYTYININRDIKGGHDKSNIYITLEISSNIVLQTAEIEDLEMKYTLGRPLLIVNEKDVPLYTYNEEDTEEDLDRVIAEIKERLKGYVDEAKVIHAW